jgi:hypothetical protein
VAGPVIQATGRLEFEDGLGSGHQFCSRHMKSPGSGKDWLVLRNHGTGSRNKTKNRGVVIRPKTEDCNKTKNK